MCERYVTSSITATTIKMTFSANDRTDTQTDIEPTW
jgi:hypothetical protein